MSKKMVFLGIFALVAVAIVTAGVVAAGHNGASGRSPLPAGPLIPGDAGTVRMPAPIEAVDFLVMESFPPQYAAQISYGLPSGCASPGGHEVERHGNEVRISVYILQPADPNVVCTQIYGITTDTVMLGSDFAPGATYTLKVNELVTTFTAQ